MINDNTLEKDVSEKASKVMKDLQKLFQDLESEAAVGTGDIVYISQTFFPRLVTSCILLEYIRTESLASRGRVASMFGGVFTKDLYMYNLRQLSFDYVATIYI